MTKKTKQKEKSGLRVEIIRWTEGENRGRGQVLTRAREKNVEIVNSI